MESAERAKSLREVCEHTLTHTPLVFSEHDECVRGLNTCDENALCFNTVGGHSCSCKPGYVGNGTVCRALCEGQCLNGGSCVSPDTCVCQQGFTGKRCETVCARLFVFRHSALTSPAYTS
ncbi:Protein kinase C-binding protein NELL2 [Labeo rohita]|uniref:Protein kinase C-binding protein NELL2 n=1 Tax=Labeo rohita TaxID=84645 RepID=A0ABQ8MRG5_LABRO|nr:Protein kinase C-binding protein NELL2 [Labeo rohita]